MTIKEFINKGVHLTFFRWKFGGPEPLNDKEKLNLKKKVWSAKPGDRVPLNDREWTHVKGKGKDGLGMMQ